MLGVAVLGQIAEVRGRKELCFRVDLDEIILFYLFENFKLFSKFIVFNILFMFYISIIYFGFVLFSTISCPLPAGRGGCVTRCKASFLCLASGLAGWLATAGQGSRRGISHGYAATMFFGGSACFRASWVVETPPAPWGRRERAAAGGGPRVGG